MQEYALEPRPGMEDYPLEPVPGCPDLMFQPFKDDILRVWWKGRPLSSFNVLTSEQRGLLKFAVTGKYPSHATRINLCDG